MAGLPDKLFLIWFKSSGRYSKLCSILAQSGWTVSVVQNADSLALITGEHTCCLAILDPTSDFTERELDQITAFLSTRRGNSSALVAISANAEDDSRPTTNINELTGRLYGVEFQEDCVVRPNAYELYHPKEAMLEEFVANRGLAEVLERYTDHKPSEDRLSRPRDGPVQFGPRIIYARGCTLRVLDGAGTKGRSPPTSATIMMTSSRWSLPGGQPICTFHRAGDSAPGSAIVLGSCQLLSDSYLDKEDNRSLVGCFLDFLSPPPHTATLGARQRAFPINVSDARTVEIAESNMTADVGRLAREPIGCLSRLESLPAKRAQLIDATLFALDNSKLALVMDAHRKLNVKYEPLTLMRPHIEWGVANRKLQSASYLLRRGEARSTNE